MDKLTERLDKLRSLVQDRDFLEGKGLSNEVNIRIFCYEPEEEMAVRHFVEQLMADEDAGGHVWVSDLYVPDHEQGSFLHHQGAWLSGHC